MISSVEANQSGKEDAEGDMGGRQGKGHDVLNGMIRECFTEKVMGVLSPGGDELARTSARGHRKESERIATTNCCMGELVLFLGRGRKGPMWTEPHGEA